MPLPNDHPDFVPLDGTIDDPDTIEHLLDIAEVATHQIKVRVDGKFYFVCPGDTIEKIKAHRERRMHLDRRSQWDRRYQNDRRKDPEANPPADP